MQKKNYFPIDSGVIHLKKAQGLVTKLHPERNASLPGHWMLLKYVDVGKRSTFQSITVWKWLLGNVLL